MTAAHETSTAFSDEVIKEHTVFELSKQQEMKEMLGRYADGQVEMLQRAMEEWDRVSRVHMLASEPPADWLVDQRARPQRRQTRLALGASLSGCMLTTDHPPSPAHPGGRVVGMSDDGRGHAPSPSRRREEQTRFCHNCRFGSAEMRRLTAGGIAPQSGMHVVAVPAWLWAGDV